MPKFKKTKNPDFEKQKFLVVKFVKEEGINWPREIRISKGLLEQYEIEFWDFLVLDYRLNCLAFFLSGAGQLLLEQKYQEYRKHKKLENLKIEKPPEYKLDEEKHGEDKIITKKKSSVMEFVNEKL